MFTFFILCEKMRGSHHASTSPPVRAAQGVEGPERRAHAAERIYVLQRPYRPTI
jgi:hypothetical protein